MIAVLKPTFSAEEFRQYAYCKRIIYFRHVAKISPRQTYKMKKGIAYHEEKVRRKSQSIKENVRITYNVFLENEELGIYALLDAVGQEGEEYYPIEFKTGKTYGIIPEHHFMQLVAQAMLIERQHKTKVKKVEIRYGQEKRVDYPLTEEDKKKIRKMQKEMTEMITREIIPEPTKIRPKCRDCEFWIACRRA